MKKKLFAICSVLVLVVSVVLITVLPLSCQPPGTVEVRALYCDATWEGAVQYMITGTNVYHDGYSVTYSWFEQSGDYTCTYVSGGPPGAYLADIAPSPTQTLAGAETIIFTLHFEPQLDASIEFLSWTINGEPYEPNTPQEPYEMQLCDIIDVHYTQHVAGCPPEVVTVKETSELRVHYYDYEGSPPPLTDFVELHVLNDDCAVVKEPNPIQKLSQNTGLDGRPVPVCTIFEANYCEASILDVETTWVLERCTNYRKTVNWLHIGECQPGPPGDSPCCALFDLLGPFPQPLVFELLPSAQVELVDGQDVDQANNSAVGNAIYIKVM